jgi:hypothetical protein
LSVIMTKRELLRYRSLLHARLAVLLEHVELATAPPAPGTGSRLRAADAKLVERIQDALQRVDAGTFGTCESCGNRIGPGRLSAHPAATECAGCMDRTARVRAF